MAGSGARPVVGVLGLQGSFREHMSALERAGAEAREVRAAVRARARARASTRTQTYTRARERASAHAMWH